MQLPGISHRKREQTFDDARQFLEFVVEDTQCFAVFVGGARLGKNQSCSAMENGEGSAELVRGIGHELPQLAHRGVHALQQMIKGFRQTAELVVRRGDRQGAPESLAVRYATSHKGSMFRERGNRREAPSYV